jgi:nicotinamide riboside kinase
MEENLQQHSKSGAEKIIRIVIFGPESTGKTTLATQLAGYYKTVCVPEYAREYLQKKWDKNKEICDIDDMLPIAYGQTKLENDSALKANKFLFCDTNLLVTKVFSEMYYNFCDSLLDKAARTHQYDFYFLTDIDVPWEKDDIRDSPEGREAVFTVFKESLIENKKPFITLSGDKETRLKKAVSILDELAIAKEIGIASHDFLQIYAHGIPLQNIKSQLNIFKNGISKTILDRPAKIGDGILKLSESDFAQKAAFFDQNKTNLKLEKFVPASGAATRMFKFLNEFLTDYDIDNESINAYINRKKNIELSFFILGMDKFPFFKALHKKLLSEIDGFDYLEKDYKNYCFINLLLRSKYFDFANKPKGVIPFHTYPDHIATPVEEHLKECTHYATVDGNSNLHFTVSDTHLSQFEEIVAYSKNNFENDSNSQINVSYSFQNKSTDTITVDVNNNPFRNDKKQLVFRPGGHGALIENLNNLDSDIVFIKNIDNVIQNNIDITTLYKKALAGVLLELQQQVFKYLSAIDKNEVTEINIQEITSFLRDKVHVELPKGFNKFTLENKIIKIKSKLNRPIRVCGMVKNEGEPGGGPFWVRGDKGRSSLQIVETAQVDLIYENQRAILSQSTHFNPVDIVCGLKNYKKQCFDLNRFVDPHSGFIVERNISDKVVKSYELPGLWNGAMAKWITVFVEVPLMTFNPVKTVNDLLKPAHQSS